MSAEQHIKTIIGEQAVQICVLQAKVEELTKELEEKNVKSSKS